MQLPRAAVAFPDHDAFDDICHHCSAFGLNGQSVLADSDGQIAALFDVPGFKFGSLDAQLIFDTALLLRFVVMLRL